MTNTTPMPPVPANLSRIELTPAHDPEFTAEALIAGHRGDRHALAETQAEDIDIDAIVKDVGLSVDTADQWLDIGLACLDQADVSLRDQDRILAIIKGRA